MLAGGVVFAALFYVMQTHNAPPSIDEQATGYLRSQNHQMGVMMGTFGLLLSQWMDALGEPGPKAVILALAAALVAAICFRVAWLIDHDLWS